TPSATRTATATPAPTAAAPARPHVFVIVMENTALEVALRQPYTARLAARYALATNYHAVGSPSLPNYLAMTSGSTWGIEDNDYHPLPATGIGAQLNAAGIPWRAYMEGLTSQGCLDSPDPYALKHNPFAYYGGACPANVVPLTALAADLASGAQGFTWITPDLCNDGHDCGPATADTWLATTVPQIVGSPSWRDGVLFIVWDEAGAGGSQRIPLIVVSDSLLAQTTAVAHDHYSLLATIEDLLGLPRLGAAAGARPLSELLRTP
ncbi:MAG: hypothetical protein M3R54_07630, partial [Chloroflexota bacterium]|nr:hypothetical protein [Chloroflexota bacterium]